MQWPSLGDCAPASCLKEVALLGGRAWPDVAVRHIDLCSVLTLVRHMSLDMLSRFVSFLCPSCLSMSSFANAKTQICQKDDLPLADAIMKHCKPARGGTKRLHELTSSTRQHDFTSCVRDRADYSVCCVKFQRLINVVSAVYMCRC